jgi:hypothetical protein
VYVEIRKPISLESMLYSIRSFKSSSSTSVLLPIGITADKQIIDDSILCVHGGLSPDIRTLDQVRIIPRAQEVPHEGAFCGMSPPHLIGGSC